MSIYQKVEAAMRAAIKQANNQLGPGEVETIIQRHLKPLASELNAPKSRIGFGNFDS